MKTITDKKSYYQPQTAMTKIRHLLADGRPTHELLHYMHNKKKLTRVVRDLAEAAETLHQVKLLLEAVRGTTALSEVGNGAAECCRLLSGMEIDGAIDVFSLEARKILIEKTMKEPE